MSITLRDYQQALVANVEKLYLRGRRSVCVVSFTGSGKTVTAAAAATRLSHVLGGAPILWLAHRKELIRQAHHTLTRLGYKAGVIAPWAHAIEAPIQVASVQTLYCRGDVPPATIVVEDEAHHFVSETYMEVLCKYPKSTFHIGLTATPERADGTGLSPLYSTMIVMAQPGKLIRHGHLVPAEVLAPEDAIDRGIADDPYDLWAQHARGLRTVIFCQSVEHSEEVARSFCDHGVAAASVDGEMPTKERTRLLERFERGRLMVLTNCQLLTEGWDVPAIECVVIARTCGSPGMWVQMTGRGGRPFPGKRRNFILDLSGSSRVFGLPDADREYSLTGKPIMLKGDSIEAGTFRCKACGIMCRRDPGMRECPSCHVPLLLNARIKTPRKVGSKLVRVARFDSGDRRTRDYERWIKYAQIQGLPRAWADRRFEEKYGTPF